MLSIALHNQQCHIMDQSRKSIPFNKKRRQPIKVESEVHLICFRILKNGIHRRQLSRLLHEQYIRRQRFVLHLLPELLQLCSMFPGLVHEGALNVAHNHVDGNPVLDASRHDDICSDSDVNLV